jgi:hypothetical protein
MLEIRAPEDRLLHFNDATAKFCYNLKFHRPSPERRSKISDKKIAMSGL